MPRGYNRNAYKCFYDNIKTVPCKRCGSAYERTNPNRHFCGDICRFMSKTRHAGDCLLWTGGTNKKGYGGFRYFDGKSTRAHRASYALFVADIPPGMHVLHTCDNPSCVNPSHLFLGTNQDNVDDKIKKGRIRYAENHPRWNPSAPQHGRSVKKRKTNPEPS